MDGGDYTFLPYLFELESSCAHKLLELNAHPSAAVSMDFEQELLALERESSISLDGEQRKAVLASAQSGVLVITGGPGTGKTTIVDFVITLMEKMGLSVELCAPTGRAAKRLSEATAARPAPSTGCWSIRGRGSAATRTIQWTGMSSSRTRPL